MIAAARYALYNDPVKSQFFHPGAQGRLWLSAHLLSMNLPLEKSSVVGWFASCQREKKRITMQANSAVMLRKPNLQL